MDLNAFDWKYLYTGLEGRISRLQYWVAAIALAVVSVVLQWILGQVSLILALIVSLVFLYPAYALMVKRGYDRNRPAIIAQVFLGLVVLLNLVTVFLGPASILLLPLSLVMMVAGIALLIDYGFLRGTVGPNRYGPDPLAGQTA